MCGSGTLAIEAAIIATRKAAGLLRPNYGIKHILGFEESAWKSLRSELQHASMKEPKIEIIATDIDRRAIEARQKILEQLGLIILLNLKSAILSLPKFLMAMALW